MKKILLIDGNALMYKSFYSTSFLLQKGEGFDDKGQPINALRTFSNMIFNLFKNFSDFNFLVAFDSKDIKTYRNEYSFYKEGRKKMPEELIYQKPLIEEMLNLVGIKQYSSKDYEADDIIGILAKKFSSENKIVNIITSDKDLLQLVDENTTVFISKTGVSKMVEYNYQNFSSLFYGLNPSQVIDLKGIMGDSSDNLIGIKGIGEKGAIKLLLKYKNLENVYENKDELSNSIKVKIMDNYEMGKLCKEIATIITRGNIDIDFTSLKRKDFDQKKLIAFLRYNSIHNLANRLESEKW